tara:strand:- start:572 stop:1510 length:939 start_codon:yes stop_codon:yes gene_type:complete
MKSFSIKFILKVLSLTCLTLTFFSIIFLPRLDYFFISYIENNFSIDNYLEPSSIFGIRLYLIFFIFNIFLLGLITSYRIRTQLKNLISKIIDLPKLRLFLKRDNFFTKTYPKLTFIISTFTSVLLTLYFLIFKTPSPEGNLEFFSSNLFLLSALLFFCSAFVCSFKESLDHKRSITITLFIFALLMVFIYGEEVSWGQNYFGWEAKYIFIYNFQKETTFHNFFNPLFPILYSSFGSLFLAVAFLGWFFPSGKKTSYGKFFEISPSMIVLVFLTFSFSISPYFTEMFEQLFSLFCFLYSSRLLINLLVNRENI